MKKGLFIIVLLLFLPPNASACVGRVLHIGVLDSAEGRMFGELLSTLITERTGTAVEVKMFGNSKDLYGAVTTKDVDILIENTSSALRILKQPDTGDAAEKYNLVKEMYEKEKGLIWLKPFGFTKRSGEDRPSHTTTLLRYEVVENFPALPRVINKLGSTISDDAYDRMLKSVESGREPKDVARDFLQARKLI